MLQIFKKPVILSSLGWDCLNLASLWINVAFLNNCSERRSFIFFKKRLERYCAFLLALLWFWSGEGQRSEAWRFSSPSVWLHLSPRETSDTWFCRWGWGFFFFDSCQIEDVSAGSQTDSLIACDTSVSKTGWSLGSLIWLKCATSGHLCSNSVFINCNHRLCW